MQDSVDLSEEVAKLPSFPVIVPMKSDVGSQFFVAAENEIITESEDMGNAIVDLLSVYFTFNMAYSTPLYPVLLFLQHHVLGTKDKQRVPNIVNIIYSALDKVKA